MPVGHPLDNTAVFIVPLRNDSAGNPAAQHIDGLAGLDIAKHGSVGEVCIAGACVAAGYLGQSHMAAR